MKKKNLKSDIVNCKSQAMLSLYMMTERIALSSAPALIIGPTGSGKENIANRLHTLGNNPEAPFIDVNCGSIPENLMESELFGHEKGAFTGAAGKHKGYFELAGEGTIFLDEISELPLIQQVRLLRVLDNLTFRPVGSESSLPFKGKIVAATNRDLGQLVKENKFREDLFHRLNVFTLAVPGLDERREDIPYFLQHFAANQREDLTFSNEAITEITAADWPGNVRQLKNFVERIAFVSEESCISAASARSFLSEQSSTLHDSLMAITDKIKALDCENKLATLEYHIIQQALEDSGGNKSTAAKALGVHRKVIERRMKAFDADANEIHILCASGKNHMVLSDYTGALRHYDKALKYEKKYPCSRRFESLKFEILLKQCVCLRNLYGWNNCDISKKYDEAMILGERLQKVEKLPTIYFGIWAKHLMDLELTRALELATKYLSEGRSRNNPALISQAYIAMAYTKFWLGAFEEVKENLDDFIECYDSNSEIFTDYGYDPFVWYLIISSLTSFHLGDFENSKQILSQVQRYTEETKNPFSTAMALQAGAWISFCFGDLEESHRYCTRLSEGTMDTPFTFYTGLEVILKSYYTALDGKSAEGIRLINEGFRKANNEDGLFFHSLYSILLGRVHIKDHNINEGLDCIQRGIRIADEKEELCYMSELLCVRGELNKLSGDTEKAEADFNTAIEVAAGLKSIPAELKASYALADLLSSKGRVTEAEKILSEILAKIPEGESAYEFVRTAREKHEEFGAKAGTF